MILLPSASPLLPLKEKYSRQNINSIMNNLYSLFKKSPNEYDEMIGTYFVSPFSIICKIEKKTLLSQGKDASMIPEITLSPFRNVVISLAAIVFRYIFTSGIFSSSEKAGEKGLVYLGLLSGLNLFMMSKDKYVYYYDDNTDDIWLYGGPVFFNAKMFIEQCLGEYALKNATSEKEKQFVEKFMGMPFDKQELYLRGMLDMLFSYFEFKEEPVVLQIYNG